MKYVFLFIGMFIALPVVSQIKFESNTIVEEITKGIKESDILYVSRKNSQKDEIGEIEVDGLEYRINVFWLAYFNSIENKDILNKIYYEGDEFQFDEQNTKIYKPIKKKKYILATFEIDSDYFIHNYDFNTKSFNFDLIRIFSFYTKDHILKLSEYGNDSICLKSLNLTKELPLKILPEKARDFKNLTNGIKNRKLYVLFEIKKIELSPIYNNFVLYGETNYINQPTRVKQIFLKPLKINLTYTNENGELEKF